jgi:hypothetical protein
MTLKELPSASHGFDNILSQSWNFVDKQRFSQVQLEGFEAVIRAGLEEYFEAATHFGFSTSEQPIEPTAQAFGKLEGYIELLATLGDTQAAAFLEGLVARAMTAAYVARIPT